LFAELLWNLVEHLLPLRRARLAELIVKFLHAFLDLGVTGPRNSTTSSTRLARLPAGLSRLGPGLSRFGSRFAVVLGILGFAFCLLGLFLNLGSVLIVQENLGVEEHVLILVEARLDLGPDLVADAQLHLAALRLARGVFNKANALVAGVIDG